MEKWAIFDENPKGLTLLFIPKLTPEKLSHFWWKSQGVNLTFFTKI